MAADQREIELISRIKIPKAWKKGQKAGGLNIQYTVEFYAHEVGVDTTQRY
jgi:hypothetical protein